MLYLLQVNVGLILFYALYKLVCTRDTFFRSRRFILIVSLVLPFILPFIDVLQEQYLFLVRHKIESVEELVSVLDNLTDKKKEASKEKSKTYKAKERFKDIFDKAEDTVICYGTLITMLFLLTVLPVAYLVIFRGSSQKRAQLEALEKA